MSNHKPPAAIKTKAQKLDLGGLHAAYGWLPLDQPVGFRLAFDWFGSAVPQLLRGDPLDTDRQRSYDRAVKAKALGDQACTPEEALHAWSTALRLYEKVWSSKNLPSVDAAITAPPGRQVAAIQNLLAALNKAYLGRATFGVTTGAAREYEGTSVRVPVAELTALTAQPAIKAVLAEAVTVAKLISVDNGKLDGAKFLANLPLVLDGVGEWAGGAPQPKATTPVTPRTPRASTGIKPGSDMDLVLQMLQTSTPTVEEIAAKTGWKYHKVTMTVSNLRGKGHNITRQGKRYHIA